VHVLKRWVRSRKRKRTEKPETHELSSDMRTMLLSLQGTYEQTRRPRRQPTAPEEPDKPKR
jgi:hypothetical protein